MTLLTLLIDLLQKFIIAGICGFGSGGAATFPAGFVFRFFMDLLFRFVNLCGAGINRPRSREGNVPNHCSYLAHGHTSGSSDLVQCLSLETTGFADGLCVSALANPSVGKGVVFPLFWEGEIQARFSTPIPAES
jgi:hypothetical protein